MRMLISLAEKIKESMSGIKNLIDTYQGFHTAVSRLECLEQDIITPLYISLKHFIPSQYHTPVLRASLLSTATTGGDKLPPIYESPSAPEMPLHSMRNIERASQTISSPILTPDSPYHGGEPFMVRSMPVDIPAHLAHSFRPHTN
jgi:hypothetical protein